MVQFKRAFAKVHNNPINIVLINSIYKLDRVIRCNNSIFTLYLANDISHYPLFPSCFDDQVQDPKVLPLLHSFIKTWVVPFTYKCSIR